MMILMNITPLPIIQARRRTYEVELLRLQSLPLSEEVDRQILFMRGRLIKQMILECRHPQNTGNKAVMENNIRLGLARHKDHTKERLQKVKRDANFGIVNSVKVLTEEVALKIQKLITASAKTTFANDGQQLATGLAETTANIGSTSWSLLKVPLSGTLRVVSKTGMAIGFVLTLPAHLIAFPIHSIITVTPLTYPATTGLVIHNVGLGLGKMLGQVAEVTEKGVRRV